MAYPDLIDLEFNLIMKMLDLKKPCVSEDFERQQCQGVNCRHGIPRQQCVDCKIVIKPYWPGGGTT